MPLPASVALPPRAREALERLVARLVERFPADIVEVRLFGSRARGDARPGSDVDVLVVVRDEAAEDTEERIEEERAAAWDAGGDEYAHLIAFVLQEKHVPVTPAERAAIEEGLRARGLTLDDLLPMLGLLVMREEEFRRGSSSCARRPTTAAPPSRRRTPAGPSRPPGASSRRPRNTAAGGWSGRRGGSGDRARRRARRSR